MYAQSNITFANKKSYDDFGLILKKQDIPPAEKVEIRENIPYMDGDYDFSKLYGKSVYKRRMVTCTFVLIANSTADLFSKRLSVVEWLSGKSDETLYIDAYGDYYHFADVSSTVASITEISPVAIEIVVTFTCAPYLQSTVEHYEFSCTGSSDYTIVHNGKTPVTPLVTYENSSRSLQAGVNVNPPPKVPNGSGTEELAFFSIRPGTNTLRMRGIGSISFDVYEEVL